MKTLPATLATSLVAASVLLGSSPAVAADHTLPPAAAKVIKANFPNATITGIGRERERGARYYEVNLRESGRKYEVEITKEGVIGEIEAKVKLSDVPDELLGTIRKRVGAGRISRVEKHERRGIARAGKFVPLKEPRVMYEVKYYTVDGRRREVQVASDRILELPDEVRGRLKAAFPQARIREVEAEDDDGIMVFMVELVDGDERIEVNVLADGRIMERLLQTDIGQAPPAILKILKADKELRRSDAKRIYKRETRAVVEDGKIVPRRDTSYVVFVMREDRMREYLFDGDGKPLNEPQWEAVDDEDDGDDEDDDD